MNNKSDKTGYSKNGILIILLPKLTQALEEKKPRAINIKKEGKIKKECFANTLVTYSPAVLIVLQFCPLISLVTLSHTVLQDN